MNASHQVADGPLMAGRNAVGEGGLIRRAHPAASSFLVSAKKFHLCVVIRLAVVWNFSGGAAIDKNSYKAHD